MGSWWPAGARPRLGRPGEGNLNKQLLKEIEKRRTFGIISHPDAGKTTLTEKLLLFGGADSDGRRGQGPQGTSRHALSDWIAIESSAVFP